MNRINFLFFISLIIFSPFSFSEALVSRTLVVGSEENYPPFATGNNADEASGFTIDLWKKVAAESNLKYTIRVAPFHILLQEFKDGKIDVMLNLAQSDERRNYSDFSIPHVVVHAAIFVRTESNTIQTENDLKDKSVLVVKSDIAAEYALNQHLYKRLIEVPSAIEGLKLLSLGQYDAMLINKLVGLQTLQELKIKNVRALPILINATQKFSFAVPKGHSSLLERINEGLFVTKLNGDYNAVYDKWFNVYEPREPSKLELLEYSSPFTVIFILILLVIYFKRRNEKIKINANLRDSEQRWKFALEGSGDGVWDTNLQNGKVVFSNQWKSILGYSESDIDGSISQLKSIIHPEDVDQVFGNLKNYFNQKSHNFVCECRMLCKDQTWKWILTRGMVVERDANNNPTRMIGTITDIDSRKTAEAEISNLAHFDQITSLPNRLLFMKRLKDALINNSPKHHFFAVMLLDLDHFKEVNDSLGHYLGDDLLRQTAERLLSCVKRDDTVARLGGDEFTLIIQNIENIQALEQILLNILKKLSEAFELDGNLVYVSASIGVTLFPVDGQHVEKLLKNADHAMYQAKALGRNQYCYYSPAMQESADHKARLANDLRSALIQNQLFLVYQPILQLKDNTVQKAEALIRWQHPELGLIPPCDFIPIAEETGLIHEIGNWVFEETAKQIKSWQETKELNLQVSINKSPVQFRKNKNSCKTWLEILKDLNLDGNSICVEITESVLVDPKNSVKEQLLFFRDNGLEISLDDFGTGYSSLTHIKTFDIDYIKIDKTFVSGLGYEKSANVLCEAIIAMAHKLDLKVIAEGIETIEQRDFLIAAGCDYGQGYLFSKPLTNEKFEAYVMKAD